MKKNKKVYYTDMEDVLLGVLGLLIILGLFMMLNRNYTKGVEACVEKGNDVSYCEYHASR